MLDRSTHRSHLTRLLDQFPVVGLVGARQVGKTTLARSLAETWDGPVTSFDLESEPDRARLEQPELALRSLTGLVVIDEVHHAPGLFSTLRVLADRPDAETRFLVLGSASPELLRQGAETLAGRIAFHELSGFDGGEVGSGGLEDLWLRGGFPPSFLARSDEASVTWREEFVRTFLERDLPSLGLNLPATTIRRFWTMVAHVHGQRWSGAELARSLDVSQSTIRRWLDLLAATYMARVLPPWHLNTAKRQVKAPKVYLADTGLLHVLLGLHGCDDVLSHPRCGASWEGFALGEVVSALGVRPHECFHWALHSGAELDLLIVRGERRQGFEFKRTDAPRSTRSMHAAVKALELDELLVIHAGDHEFPMTDAIRALPLQLIRDRLEPWSG